MRPFERQATALVAYTAVLTLVSYGMARGDRLPLPSWELLAFPACALAAGFWLDRWRAVLLCLVPVAALATFNSDLGPVVFYDLFFGVPAMALASAVGVAARRGFNRLLRGRPEGGRAQIPQLLGVVVAGGAAAPVLVALAEQGDVVRVQRPHPIAVDERAGRVDGVGIGDPAARVIAVFGNTPRWTIAEPVAPLELSINDYLGPLYVPKLGSGPPDFLRYDRVSFDVTGGRVNAIEVIDANAETRRGIGPGDSISLVGRLYPKLRCGEGDAGEDEPIPFRYCTGQTGPGRYIYFSGDYTKHGTPITDITITPVRLNS